MDINKAAIIKSFTTLLLLFSTSVLAEEIDLTKDAMYYCSNDALVGIAKGKGQVYSSDALGKFTMKVKDGNLNFEGDNLTIASTSKGTFTLYEDYVFLATLNGAVFVEIRSESIIYSVTFLKFFGDQKALLASMQGTCTKW